MNAFCRTDTGLYKVYRHGADWQVIGPHYEKWYSVWSADVVGSLMRAINSIPGSEKTVEIIGLS